VVIEGILVEGLLYGIMVLGVFITFRVMDFPDLTVDGTFPFGAAVMAACLTAGVSPLIALALAFVAGILAGSVTAAIHNYLKVPGLLAGILTMTMLWSVNIRVMGGKANQPLIGTDNVLHEIERLLGGSLGVELSHLIMFAAIILLILVLLNVFFRTDLGISIGAMGNNPQMVISVGQDPRQLKFIGLGLSNGLVALSGAFSAQYQGFADVNLGQGIIIAGLASVMLGEFVLRSNKISILTLRVVLGSILYRAIMYLGRYYGYYIGLTPSDLKLLTGILIVVAIIVSKLKNEKTRKPVGQKGRNHA